MATRLQRLRRSEAAGSFTLAGPAFRRAAPWLLALVVFVGLATRIHPLVRFAVWGSDSGEYFFLTQQLVDTGRILFEYDGWGLAYPYFPGMFIVSGAAHAVLGVDVVRAVQWVTPALAMSIPALVGLLAYRITSDPRVGIVAGAVAAVSAVVVITTSHPMPGTLGQVFLLGILALLPESYKDRAHLGLFAVLGAALLFTHHLSTYFAIGILAFIPFFRELTQRHAHVQRLRVEVPLVLALLLGALLWWLGVAVPFREQIVGDALPFPPAVTAALFLAALVALPAIVLVKRTMSGAWAGPRYPSFQRQRAYFLSSFLGFTGLLLFVTFVRVPGTDIRVDPVTLLYAVPVLAMVSFLPAGVALARFHKQGTLILAWLYAILGSLAFATLTNSKVLFPFRHVDYMWEAMSPLIAMGIVMTYDQIIASRVPGERASARANVVAGVAILLVAGAVLSLPPREVIGGFEEGITDAEMSAVSWIEENPHLIPPTTTMAADHRVSSLLFGLAGIHATWDYTPRTYHSEDPREALAELQSVLVPPRDGEARVDYVFLSWPIEQGVTLLQWEQSRPMTAAAIAKFEDPEWFEPVYSEDGVRIYRVKWETWRAEIAAERRVDADGP